MSTGPHRHVELIPGGGSEGGEALGSWVGGAVPSPAHTQAHAWPSFTPCALDALPDATRPRLTAAQLPEEGPPSQPFHFVMSWPDKWLVHELLNSILGILEELKSAGAWGLVASGVCMCVCASVHVCICVCVWVTVRGICVWLSVCVCTSVFVCALLYVCIFVCG